MHALGQTLDEECVEWAVSERMAERDSPGLRVLAGEVAPFNLFEMASLVDRTLGELRVTRFACAEEAAAALTFELARQITGGESEPGAVLFRIHRFHYEPYAPPDLGEFVRLYRARLDFTVEGADHSWYRPDCTPGAIDAVILDECARWMEFHPHGPSGKALSG